MPRYAHALRRAGVKRINISIDSLRPDRFHAITRNGEIEKTLAGIDAAIAAGFERIKLNAVVLKNHNHDEVLDLVGFAIDRGLDISFIEEMPLGIIGEHDRAEAYYSSDLILADLRKRYEMYPTTESTGGPSRYYRIAGQETRVGFISPHSHNFCDQCNRVRLTAEGRLLLFPVAELPDLPKGKGLKLIGVRGNDAVAPSAWEQTGDGSIQTTPSQLVIWADN